MTFTDKLAAAWEKNNSLLCVGLDPYAHKLPASIASEADPLFAFNKAIIDATAEFTCGFKPNTAMYEAAGEHGIAQLKQTCDYLVEKYPELPIILDAKRADIGSTNDGYVQFAFDYLQADAITVHPYLGKEALAPFLAQANKGIIVLCRTSNDGAGEFQDLELDAMPLYQHVAKHVAEDWNANNNCLLVIGATYPDEMQMVRDLVGDDMIFLVPGVGAQGGDVEATVKAGINRAGTGVVINSSRGIIYASSGDDFAEAARREAENLRNEINKHRS